MGQGEGRELCSPSWEVPVMSSAWHVLAPGVVCFVKAEAPEFGRTVRKERARPCH